MILLVALPAVAALIGLALYLSGGRYISTDNAYVGAQKVLITPDISDKIIHVAVVEGQHVKPGDELFTLDPVPFRLALEHRAGQARGGAQRLRQADDDDSNRSARWPTSRRRTSTSSSATSTARASW